MYPQLTKSNFFAHSILSSEDMYAPFLAPLILIVNIVKVTVIGLSVVKDVGVVNSMTRHGDHRCILLYLPFFLFASPDEELTVPLVFPLDYLGLQRTSQGPVVLCLCYNSDNNGFLEDIAHLNCRDLQFVRGRRYCLINMLCF